MKSKPPKTAAKEGGMKQKPKVQKAKGKEQRVSAKEGGLKQKGKVTATSVNGNEKSTLAGLKQYGFFENVYEVARLIPKGRVTSYGAIAKYLGTGKSARTVGYAMNGSGTQIPVVPAHRVLNRNGMLTGKHHFSPPSLMQELLEKEGIRVKNDTVVDFANLFWDPQRELTI